MTLLRTAATGTIAWCVDPLPWLFTIGYEGQSIDGFTEKLSANEIRLLLDVRKNPVSRKPGFSRNALRVHLDRYGISYRHIPELGVPSALRKNLGTKESYLSLCEFYETDILPSNMSSVHTVMDLTAEFHRVALMCFEADYHCCHRHKIAAHLESSQLLACHIVHL